MPAPAAATPYFPPDSVIRRVSNETALLLGAGRALLLQLAHPAVAQGVQDHSEFKRNPFKRLQGTLEAMHAAVYGSEWLAAGVGQRIQRVHDFIVGPTYRANDPANLLWVHATLVDTVLHCYETYAGPLGAGEQETYYREMARVAELFGVPRDAQPATLAEFRSYVDDVVAGLEITDAGRELGAYILDPQLPARLDVPLSPLLGLQRVLTEGSLPPRLREQYGIAWDGAAQARYERARRRVRRLYRATPSALRNAPNEVGRKLLLRQAARHVRDFELRVAS